MLFRIKDATLDANNAPEWERLFVQGVGNYLQGWQGANGLSRERAAELEGFMNDTASDLGRFFRRMAVTNVNGLAQAALDVGFGRRKPAVDPATLAARDHTVTDTEKLWLDARIDANDRIDHLDEALLRFLEQA